MTSAAIAACCGAVMLAAYLALFSSFRIAHTAYFHESPATIVNGQLISEWTWKPFIPLMYVDARLTGRGAAVVDVHGIVWYVNGTGEPLGR